MPKKSNWGISVKGLGIDGFVVDDDNAVDDGNAGEELFNLNLAIIASNAEESICCG